MAAHAKGVQHNNLGFRFVAPATVGDNDRHGARVAESAASRYATLLPHLDEKQRRELLGIEAQRLGRGGIKAIAEAAGVHPDTLPGGGRKKLTETDPELLAELKALVDPETRGDPMSPLVWTTKSTRNLAGRADRGRASDLRPDGGGCCGGLGLRAA